MIFPVFLMFFLAQTPAPVYDIQVIPSANSARVSWKVQTRPEESSYIKYVHVYLDGSRIKAIDQRGTEYTITNLKPVTHYEVEIETEDDSKQKSSKVSEQFTTTKPRTYT